MSLFHRIKNWFTRVLRRRESSDEIGLKCSICGTAVPDGGDNCSLCGSTDLIPPNDARTSSAQSLSPDSAVHHTEPASDESVAQLQRVRTEEILANNPDLWTQTPEGIEVSLADETKVVASKQEAAQLLKESE